MKTNRFIRVSMVALIIFAFAATCNLYAGDQSAKKKNRKVTISGRITNLNKQPVAGAMIFVDQVFTNTYTNANGEYKIKVAPTIKQISALSPVYGVQKLEIKSEMTASGYGGIDMVLTNVGESGDGIASKDSTDNPFRAVLEKPEDEMVNIGYGEVSRKNVNMEVNKVTGQHHYQVYSNMYDMIRGEVPGVEVSGKSIRIRDAFSFNLSTEPLMSVDGIIVSNLDAINPIDVKSIEVLKGAAASVYGARGANGVILITTLKGNEKRGKK